MSPKKGKQPITHWEKGRSLMKFSAEHFQWTRHCDEVCLTAPRWSSRQIDWHVLPLYLTFSALLVWAWSGSMRFSKCLTSALNDAAVKRGVTRTFIIVSRGMDCLLFCRHVVRTHWLAVLLRTQVATELFWKIIPTRVRARGSVVNWCTMLQSGGPRVPLPMRPLDFSIDLILPATLWLGSRLRP
jgi:hypothetical protein